MKANPINNKKLINLAKGALKNAVAPCSHFRVGAALLGKSGKIYTGSNIESSSMLVSSCAERTAMLKALSEGERHFVKIAVLAKAKNPCYPCGVCRQFMSEFSPGIKIVVQEPRGILREIPIADFLPMPFKRRPRKR